MKRIKLTQDKYVIVDDYDYPKLAAYKWYANKLSKNTYYACRNIYEKGKGRVVLMHRQIMDAQKGVLIDHINENGLDNRRKNLRFATASQNQLNRGAPASNTSGYKNISWDKVRKKYLVHVRFQKKQKNLGRFATIEEAKKCLSVFVKENHGEFAKL